MTAQPKQISPLRQRMIDDMIARKFSPRTRSCYVRAVSRFSTFCGGFPQRATAEDLRQYQARLGSGGVSGRGINGTISALRFQGNRMIYFAVIISNRKSSSQPAA